MRLAVKERYSYLLCVNECRGHAQSRDQRNAEGVVIVIVDGPQNNTRNLEDIKRMYDLGSDWLVLVNAGDEEYPPRQS